jgi:hypothetical protein
MTGNLEPEANQRESCSTLLTFTCMQLCKEGVHMQHFGAVGRQAHGLKYITSIYNKNSL